MIMLTLKTFDFHRMQFVVGGKKCCCAACVLKKYKRGSCFRDVSSALAQLFTHGKGNEVLNQNSGFPSCKKRNYSLHSKKDP